MLYQSHFYPRFNSGGGYSSVVPYGIIPQHAGYRQQVLIRYESYTEESSIWSPQYQTIFRNKYIPINKSFYEIRWILQIKSPAMKLLYIFNVFEYIWNCHFWSKIFKNRCLKSLWWVIITRFILCKLYIYFIFIQIMMEDFFQEKFIHESVVEV